MAIEIDGLAEVVINVRHPEQSLVFYQDVLGLRRISPLDRPGPIFLSAGTASGSVPSMVVLVPLPPDAAAFVPPRSLHHLALTVPETKFDEARATLERAGFEVRGGTHPVLAVRTAYVTDPDGNDVELISPKPAG